MPTFLEMITTRRAEARARLDTLLEQATGEERTALTPEETVEFDALAAELREIDGRAEELRTQADADARLAAFSERAAAGVVRVGREPLTYERHDMRSSYFRDLALANISNDAEARQRVQRHGVEMDVELRSPERRDISRTDTAGGEFVPPLWMVDEYVRIARAGRVTANLCNQRPLPSGTDSINLPRITTGTAVAAQTADNAAVQETDIVTASIAVPVRTIAGQQDVALQLLEQSPLAFDEVIFQDLSADYAAKVDQQVISGTGANGQVVGFRTITSVDTTAYTDASPTLAEAYPKIADSLNEVISNRLMPAECLIMHPRRWLWMVATLGSDSRPLISMDQMGPQNAMGVTGELATEGFAGWILGTRVYVDPNIPTTLGGGTEDVIIATRPSDAWLFEGALRTRALPEVLSGTLTVRLQLYRYVAFTAERYPRSTSLIGGTGLAAPTF